MKRAKTAMLVNEILEREKRVKKVKTGLSCCTQDGFWANCERCPYCNKDGAPAADCVYRLLVDANELFKEILFNK